MIDKKILQTYINQKLNNKEIAKKLNVSLSTVNRYIKKYELTSTIGSQGARKHLFNERYFETIDTEEKAYWLGFIAADGCVYHSNNSWRLQINLKGSDIGHLIKFQKAIGSDYKIAEKTIGNSQVAQLKVNSKTLCDTLQKHNIVERKSIIFSPPSIRQDLIRHFIRGYWDGDGWIKSYKRKESNGYRNNIGIIGGEPAIKFFKDNLPVELSIYKIKNKDNLVTLETSDSKKIRLIYDYFYKDSTIFLDRKKELFENILSRITEM